MGLLHRMAAVVITNQPSKKRTEVSLSDKLAPIEALILHDPDSDDNLQRGKFGPQDVASKGRINDRTLFCSQYSLPVHGPNSQDDLRHTSALTEITDKW